MLEKVSAALKTTPTTSTHFQKSTKKINLKRDKFGELGGKGLIFIVLAY